ncbi:MAG: hypothetical protein K2Y51_09270 [Gammaproteobacteria bacterium]|nr:hypothetical protein [Gammaproteobacteria bacterium]
MKQIDASYDEIADVLYLTSGPVHSTKNREDEAGLVLRYDAKSLEPVGATIIDFKEYWFSRREHLKHRLASFFHISEDEARKVLHT